MDETLYREVTQSIKAVFDLTARVDERVKMLVERQVQTDDKIEDFSRNQTELVSKVSVLETRNEKEFIDELRRFEAAMKDTQRDLKEIDQRLYHVEKSSHSNENRWKQIYHFVRDTVWVIIVCYLLYRLGLQPPPFP